MKAPRTTSRARPTRRSFVRVALLLICALLSHSLDNCAAHLGGPFGATQAQHMDADCSGAADGICKLCGADDKPHSDGCDPATENAILTPSQQHIQHEAATLTAISAAVPAVPQLIALSGCLHGRAAPPPDKLVSVYLRSSLPSRAPPVSA